MNMGIDDSDRKEEFQIPAIRNEPGYVQIPTTDPQAALLFCQALAKSLTINSKQRFIAQSDSKTEFLQQRPAISVVIPVFDEEDNLPLLYQRLTDVLGDVEPLYELIFVDDGSVDNSWKVISGLRDGHRRVSGFRLSRNYGQHNALLCGIRAAEFEIIITMDDDLQNPVSEIPKLLNKLDEGYDVVLLSD